MKDYFIHETAIVDEGCHIGKGTHIWHFSHLMGACSLGMRCNVGQNVFIANGVKVGNNVKIQNNVSLYEGVVCEDDVFLGPSCVFTNVKNPRSHVSRKNQYQKTLIRKGASIGANATIVCGNVIGMYGFVGSGSVITHDVPDYGLVVGNPARQIGWVSQYGHRLTFNEEGIAQCPETGQLYGLDQTGKCFLKEERGMEDVVASDRKGLGENDR